MPQAQFSHHKITIANTYSDNKSTESSHHIYTSSPYTDHKPEPPSAVSSSVRRTLRLDLVFLLGLVFLIELVVTLGLRLVPVLILQLELAVGCRYEDVSEFGFEASI